MSRRPGMAPLRRLDTASLGAKKYRDSKTSQLRHEHKSETTCTSLSKTRRTSPSKMNSGIPRPSRKGERSLQNFNQDMEARSKTEKRPFRTSSNSSSSSRGQERTKVGPQNCLPVVDTHSKILTACREPKDPKIDDVTAFANKIKTASELNNGYGKPLVTSFTKKLTILKNVKKTNNPIEPHSVARTRSPLKSWRASPQHSSELNTVVALGDKVFEYNEVSGLRIIAENSPTPIAPMSLSVTEKQKDAPKLPTKIGPTGNRLRASATSPNVKPDTKRMECRSLPRPSSRPSSLNRYDSRDLNSTRQTKSMDSKKEPSPDKVARAKDAKSWTPVTSQSPVRPSKLRLPTVYKPLDDSKLSEPLKKDQQLLKEKSPKKHYSTLVVAERLKQSMGREGHVPRAGIYNSKSFKPQLEDIKSSILLLNPNKDEGKRWPDVQKTIKPFNEEERQRQLNEVRQKFKSRGFINDSS